MAGQPDRIVAISSAARTAAIGVVRLSGPGSGACLEALTGRPLPRPRQMVVRTILSDGEPLDRAMVWWAPSPGTFTGEEMAEIHGHGNPVILDALVVECVRLGARHAEPGEFTRRALLNGRMDLASSEAVLAAIEATSLAGIRAAARVMRGDLGERLQLLRGELLEVAALLEANLDYPDDVEPTADLADRLGAVAGTLTTLATAVHEAGPLIDGVDVAIVGPANSGKSTLFNRILGDDRAIVHEQPGTTRDVVSGERMLGGIRVRFHDTAGFRDGAEEVEGEGIRRARRQQSDADVVIRVLDGTQAPAVVAAPRELVALNKVDLLEASPAAGFPISALTGEGVDTLLDHLTEHIGSGRDPGLVLWTARQGSAASEAASHLELAAGQLTQDEYGPAALEVGLALRCVDELLGLDPTESVLDELFSRFCVGK